MVMVALAVLVSLTVLKLSNNADEPPDFSKLAGGAGGAMPEMGDMPDDDEDDEMGDGGADDDDMPDLEGDDEAEGEGKGKGKQGDTKTEDVPSVPKTGGAKIEEVP